MYIIGAYIAIGKPEERVNADLDSGGIAAIFFFCEYRNSPSESRRSHSRAQFCAFRSLDPVLLALMERHALGRVL